MTTRAQILPRLLIVAGVAGVLFTAPIASGQNATERFTGFAINTNSRPTTAMIDFSIERWSSDEEREQLLSIIKEHKDPTAQLLKALERLPKVGYIRGAQTLGWDLRYARQSELEDGGRRIVLATDRPIGFWEARNSGRSMDYPFTIVEIQLDKNDRGVGKILAGTKIFIDKKNNLVLENYGQQPIRFNEIHRLK
jgi:hypothetical protein